MVLLMVYSVYLSYGSVYYSLFLYKTELSLIGSMLEDFYLTPNTLLSVSFDPCLDYLDFNVSYELLP